MSVIIYTNSPIDIGLHFLLNIKYELISIHLNTGFMCKGSSKSYNIQYLIFRCVVFSRISFDIFQETIVFYLYKLPYNQVDDLHSYIFIYIATLN